MRKHPRVRGINPKPPTSLIPDPAPCPAKWTQLCDGSGSSSGRKSYHPMARHGARAVVVGNIIVVFGGGSSNFGLMPELNVFNTSENEWTRPEVKGDPPMGLASCGMVLDGSRLLVFGGLIEPGTYSSDLYELNFVDWEWKKLNPLPPTNGPPPGPRFGHSFTIVDDRRYGPLVYLFGGLTNDNNDDPTAEILPRHLNDLYTLETRTNNMNGAWRIPPRLGWLPSPRESHSAVPYTSKDGLFSALLVYGGMSGLRHGDLYILDCKTMVWSRPAMTGWIPQPRSLHSATLIGEKMYVFGGFVPCSLDEMRLSGKLWKVSNTLMSLDVETLKWELIQDHKVDAESDDIVPRPRARAGHCGININNKIFVFGGREDDVNDFLGDMWALEVKEPNSSAKKKGRNRKARQAQPARNRMLNPAEISKAVLYSDDPTA